MKFSLFVLVLCAVIGRSVGVIRCYACSFSAVDSDQSCLTITNSTRSIDCNYQYCTIFRQEYMDPRGAIASFMRGCDDRPDFLNHDIEDANFRSYYRACTNDLCNIGDGIQSVVGGNLSPNPTYDGENLSVPGTGGGAAVLKISLILTFVSLIVNYI